MAHSKYEPVFPVFQEYWDGELTLEEAQKKAGIPNQSAFYSALSLWKARLGITRQRVKPTATPPKPAAARKLQNAKDPAEPTLPAATVIPWGEDGSLLVNIPGAGHRGKTLTIIGYPAEIVIKRGGSR